MTSILEISLWFFACRSELGSSFWIKNGNGRKNVPLIFCAFFGHFFKTLCQVHVGCQKSLTLGREIQFCTLECISPSPYTIPPFLAFFLFKRPMKPSDLITCDFSLIFLHAGLIWDLVFESKTKMGKNSLLFFARFSDIFQKLCVRSIWGVFSH